MEHQSSKSQVYAHPIIFGLLVFFLVLFPLYLSAQILGNELTTSSSKARKAYLNAEKFFSELNFSDAEKQLQRALKYDPSFIEAWLLLGEMKNEQGAALEAIAAYQYAIGIDSMFFPPVFGILGKVQLDEGFFAQASSNLKVYYSLPDLRPEVRAQLKQLIEKADFAENLVKNPYDIRMVNISSAINTVEDEYVNSLRLDGSFMLLTRKFKGEDENVFIESFFTSSLNDSIWSQSLPFEVPWKSRGNMGALTFSPDGKTLYFAGCGWHEGFGSCDLYSSKLEKGSWSDPVNMGKTVNTNSWDSQPTITPDGKELYFVSNRSGGYGGSDIWKVMLLEDNQWSKPINLGAKVNTSGNEMSPFIHPDGKTLYFSSDKLPGLGGSDLFVSRLDKAARWSKPENLGVPVNSIDDEMNLIVDASGMKAYISSNKISGFGGYDIFTFTLPDEFRPEAVSYVKAVITDAISSQSLEADFKLILLSNNEIIATGKSSLEDGSLLAVLISGNDYALHIQKEGYLFHSENFSLKEYSQSEPFLLDIRLQPVERGSKVVLKNVFFELNKAEILSESTEELLMITQFLKKNADLIVELGGHTDSTGPEALNEDLSFKRAEAVKKFFIKQGIDSDRVLIRGFGSKIPIADNITEEGRALNRRTELNVIGFK